MFVGGWGSTSGWLLGDGVSSGGVDWNGTNGAVGSSLWDVDGHLSILVDSSVDVSQVDVLWKSELASERSGKQEVIEERWILIENKPLAETVLSLDLVASLDGENVSLKVDLQLLRLESSNVELDSELVGVVLDLAGLVWNDVVEVVEHVHALSVVWHHSIVEDVTKKSHWAARVWADGHG